MAEDLNLGRSYLIIIIMIGTRNLRFYETRNLAHFEFSRNMKGLISGILEISQKFLTSQNLEKKRNFRKIPMNRSNDNNFTQMKNYNFTQMKKSRRNDISFERYNIRLFDSKKEKGVTYSSFKTQTTKHENRMSN